MADELQLDTAQSESNIAKLVSKKARKSVKKKLELTQKQNFQQTVSLVCQAVFEIYKAVTASLLIVFVTQECSDGECSAEENLHTDDGDSSGLKKLYTVGLAFNFATLFIFMCMYILEVAREHYLIAYLEENKEALITNEAVGEALRFLEPQKLKTVLSIEKYYKVVGGLAIVMYLTNIILSAIIIWHYSAGFYTWISFLTLTLFIAKKFVATYFLITAEANVYLSAYMVNPLQYNDVDPKHKLSSPV